jgi:hypothetical protein
MKFTRKHAIRVLLVFVLLFVTGTTTSQRLDCLDSTGQLVHSDHRTYFFWQKDLHNSLEQYATKNGYTRVKLTVTSWWGLGTMRYGYHGP